MSGPTPAPQQPHASNSLPSDPIAAIRAETGIQLGTGPSDEHIRAALHGFVDQFEFWYTRVIRNSVAKYRQVVVGRINPFIRRIECDGMGSQSTATRLVQDYINRNFVTAGGWALEAMARKIGPSAQKSAARGIDIQRYDPAEDTHHLYVVKSGTVTRNSDIVKALKDNSRAAEKLLRQGGSNSRVIANYAIAAGKTSSTFEDGIRRPSSAEFWSEMTGLDQTAAVNLVLAIAAAAGGEAARDASAHVEALVLLVQDYITSRTDPMLVDWEFLAKRSMQAKDIWAKEDEQRHKRAIESLLATGYIFERPVRKAAAPARPARPSRTRHT